MAEYTGIKKIDAMLDAVEPRMTRYGLPARDLFFPTERYLFDFEMEGAWQQFDTASDASYFGVWTNKELLRTLSYAESDITFIQCADAEEFDAELVRMCEFYEAAPFMVTIDESGATEHYQSRSEFFIDPQKCPPSKIQFTDEEDSDS